MVFGGGAQDHDRDILRPLIRFEPLQDFDAVPVKCAADILTHLNADTQVVGIDEAQFFDPDVVRVSQELAGRNIRVIVAGLDQDFRGEPFGMMPVLMALAERVDKLSAICMVCGEPATRTQRLVNGRPAHYHDPVVIVGASEMYEARCRRCFEPGVPKQELLDFARPPAPRKSPSA